MRLSLASVGLFSLAAAVSASPAAARPAAVVVATYPQGAQISAHGHVLAVAARTSGGRSAALLVATDGGAPAAVAVGLLPRWALPHVGTDAAGKAVVTYPRCSSRSVTTCDVYAWNIESRTERRLGVSRAGAGETEAVSDHGALVFNRWIGTREPATLVDSLQEFERTVVFFRPLAGRTRQLAPAGGRQLALRGGWIAQVRDTTGERPDDSGGVCGTSSVELVSTSGNTVRPVHSQTCGENGQAIVGPSFVGHDVVFGSATNPAGDGVVLRRGALGGRVLQGRAPHDFIGFAATGPSAGYDLHPRIPDGSDTPVYDLERITGLEVDSTTTL